MSITKRVAIAGRKIARKPRKSKRGIKELIGKQMDALARKFAATHEMNVKAEIGRLSNELAKLDRAWVFVSR